MRHLFDRDRMMNAGVTEIATATTAAIDALQGRPKHIQVAAFAAAFKLVTEDAGVDGPDALSMIDNAMNHAEGRRPEFKAIARYLKEDC